jgi:hypothetical protein
MGGQALRKTGGRYADASLGWRALVMRYAGAMLGGRALGGC